MVAPGARKAAADKGLPRRIAQITEDSGLAPPKPHGEGNGDDSGLARRSRIAKVTAKAGNFYQEAGSNVDTLAMAVRTFAESVMKDAGTLGWAEVANREAVLI